MQVEFEDKFVEKQSSSDTQLKQSKVSVTEFGLVVQVESKNAELNLECSSEPQHFWSLG